MTKRFHTANSTVTTVASKQLPVVKSTGRLHSDQQLLSDTNTPFYVVMAINDRLPNGWKRTGLAEHIKISVQFGRKWWTLPMVQAECIIAQVLQQKTPVAYYAWCWGDTRYGSWQYGGPNMRTNINRYAIDVTRLLQVNIDNGRERNVIIEDTREDFRALVDSLAHCKL